MNTTCSLSIILPTRNEAENIGPLIEKIYALLGPETEVVVVDDLSTDGTRSRVQNLRHHLPKLVLIERETTGLTSAIKRGIREASGNILAWMDCDFSHPPELLHQMAAIIGRGEGDCVVASRYVPGSVDNTFKESGFIHFHKRLSFFLNRSCAFFLVKGFRDYTSGFIMVRKSVLETTLFSGDYGEYFMELIFNISRRGHVILEIPYVSEPRKFGKSKTAENFPELFFKGWKYLWKLFSLTTPSARQGNK